MARVRSLSNAACLPNSVISDVFPFPFIPEIIHIDIFLIFFAYFVDFFCNIEYNNKRNNVRRFYTLTTDSERIGMAVVFLFIFLFF